VRTIEDRVRDLVAEHCPAKAPSTIEAAARHLCDQPSMPGAGLMGSTYPERWRELFDALARTEGVTPGEVKR
jgi:hypothetical protein